ncbi:hypothetical protein HYW76_01980 [Candidatus Pacearchaeota archaeon]|nr:hypothetical protein [Candidatus Pacearchaeota archaeon]
MRIGITGPNKLFSGDLEKRKNLLDKAAEIVAKSGNEIVLTPDKNSLMEYFGKKYLEFGGKKIFLVIPSEEKDYKNYLNTELGETISSKSWDSQADEFNRQSDLFVCIGWAWGALKEIACSQYFNKKRVLVLKEFISEQLPEELNFLLEYLSLYDFNAEISK